MARRRMIDPHIWETAYDKKWSQNELTIMLAAISAADDEGYGRTSMIKRNVSEMFSDIKFKKTLENLQDSIKIIGKIYFFLPNWSEYQTISHPSPSKIKNLTIIKDNSLDKESSGIINGSASVFGFTSEVKLSKVKRSEVKGNKVSEEEITSSVFFEKAKKLFENHTKICDPNHKTHLAPIIEIWNSVPENLTREIVEVCIVKTFEGLDKNVGLNIGYLVENIIKRITKKHEEVLSKAKGKILKEAETERISYKKQENEQILKENADKIEQYKIFYNKNQGLFSAKDKSLLVRFFKENKVLSAGGIIEPKMAKVELV